MFPDELEKRQEVADKYTEGLRDYLTTQVIPDGCVSAWAYYSVLTDNRESIMEGLKKAKIPIKRSACQ